METLIIDRKTWLRGDDYPSLLRASDKKMCCIGFFCLARGISKTAISENGEPADLSPRVQKKVSELLKKGINGRSTNNNVCLKLIKANDTREISEKIRESRISIWFKKIGVKVKFIN